MFLSICHLDIRFSATSKKLFSYKKLRLVKAADNIDKCFKAYSFCRCSGTDFMVFRDWNHSAMFLFNSTLVLFLFFIHIITPTSALGIPFYFNQDPIMCGRHQFKIKLNCSLLVQNRYQETILFKRGSYV